MTDNDNLSDDMLWGAGAIAKYLKRTERQVRYFEEKGLLPISRVGRGLVARKSALNDHFKQLESSLSKQARKSCRLPASSRDWWQSWGVQRLCLRLLGRESQRLLSPPPAQRLLPAPRQADANGGTRMTLSSASW